MKKCMLGVRPTWHIIPLASSACTSFNVTLLYTQAPSAAVDGSILKIARSGSYKSNAINIFNELVLATISLKVVTVVPCSTVVTKFSWQPATCQYTRWLVVLVS